MSPAPAGLANDALFARTQRLLAERRRDLEHLIEAARITDTDDARVEIGRLTAALEEINLLEVCLLSPHASLVLHG